MKSNKQNIDERNDNPENLSEYKRRTAIKTILAGGGAAAIVPSAWNKPVVQSLVLPSHARMTGANGFTVVGDDAQSGILDNFVSKAYALVAAPSGFLCIERGDSSDWKASFIVKTTHFTASGEFGNCEPLTCCSPIAFLTVDQENPDGSFDFKLYSIYDGCDGVPQPAATTNVPCNVLECNSTC